MCKATDVCHVVYHNPWFLQGVAPDKIFQKPSGPMQGRDANIKPAFANTLWPDCLLLPVCCAGVGWCASDIDACAIVACTQNATLVALGVKANCTDLPPPALGDAAGRTCTCPPGYNYTEGVGCLGAFTFSKATTATGSNRIVVISTVW